MAGLLALALAALAVLCDGQNVVLTPPKPTLQQFEHPYPGPFRKEECDIVTEGAICLFDGRKVLLPDQVSKGMVAHYTFDETKVLDSSGNSNHAKGAIPAGPGANAIGGSAMFNGYSQLEIPHSPSFSFAQGTMSMSFWIYLYKDPATTVKHRERWCPIVHKGAATDDGVPSLQINTQSRKIRPSILTDSKEDPNGEFKDSEARLPVNRWAHIAVVRTASDNILYVNGIRDSKLTTKGRITPNTGSLYIGGVPWKVDTCHIASYIDEFRLYNRPLLEEEIQAEASPALAGVEPAMIQLGCKQCTVEQAGRSCNKGYHLCTAMELHTGGYQVARLQGYADWHTHVWSHAQYSKETQKLGQTSATAAEHAFSVPNPGASVPTVGLGLCCSDLR